MLGFYGSKLREMLEGMLRSDPENVVIIQLKVTADHLADKDQELQRIYTTNLGIFNADGSVKNGLDKNQQRRLKQLQERDIFNIRSYQKFYISKLMQNCQLLAGKYPAVENLKSELKAIEQEFSSHQFKQSKLNEAAKTQTTYDYRLNALKTDYQMLRHSQQFGTSSEGLSQLHKQFNQIVSRVNGNEHAINIAKFKASGPLLEHVKYLMALSDWRESIGADMRTRDERIHDLQPMIVNCLYSFMDHVYKRLDEIDISGACSVRSLQNQGQQLLDVADFLKHEVGHLYDSKQDQLLFDFGFSERVLQSLNDIIFSLTDEWDIAEDDEVEYEDAKRRVDSNFELMKQKRQGDTDLEDYGSFVIETLTEPTDRGMPSGPSNIEEIIAAEYADLLHKGNPEDESKRKHLIHMLSEVALSDINKIFFKVLEKDGGYLDGSRYVRSGLHEEQERRFNTSTNNLNETVKDRVDESFLDQMLAAIKNSDHRDLCCNALSDIATAVDLKIIAPDDVIKVFSADNPQQQLAVTVVEKLSEIEDVNARRKALHDFYHSFSSELQQQLQRAADGKDIASDVGKLVYPKDTLVVEVQNKIKLLAGELTRPPVGFFTPQDKREGKLKALLELLHLLNPNGDYSFMQDDQEKKTKVDEVAAKIQSYPETLQEIYANHKDVIFEHKGFGDSEVKDLMKKAVRVLHTDKVGVASHNGANLFDQLGEFDHLRATGRVAATA